MLKDINSLVETDFCEDVNNRMVNKRAMFSQTEAREMATIIGQVYLIAHCIHCGACQTKYLE